MHVENKRTALLNHLKAAKTQPQPATTVAAGNALPEPIAIIGVAARFPQSADIQAFWQALDEDRSLIGEIPPDRFDMEQLYDPTHQDSDKIHTKWAGLIPDIRQFDPAFFGILPAEADLMDPRRRLLLMTAWHALEDAGYTPETLGRNTTGVFVAAEEDEYRQCLLERGIDTKNGTGGSASLLANQLSYTFDLKGPSELVNTMCSGAAVAIHRAVKALRTGEIEAAIVGAANLLLHPDTFIYLSRTGQLNPDHCVRSFGAGAKGFLRADGVAAVVLKPLAKAIAGHDNIYAVIRHTAVNYNGQGGMSMAAPNISAHTDLIRQCYREANIDPRQLTYIEAQGMGNPVADLAEWTAFNNALQATAREKQVELSPGYCRVSTAKPMMGHMHATSALGALLRIIRSLQTNQIHAIQGYTTINPDLDTENQPCRLATATTAWPQQPTPRLAALHSYGSGGNNAHLLVEEYQPQHDTHTDTGAPVVIPCSAASEEQCRTIVHALIDALQQHPEYALASIAFTLQQGRRPMKYRVAFIAGTPATFLRQATAFTNGVLLGDTYKGVASDKNRTLVPDTSDPASLARAWVHGAAINWERLAPAAPVQRLHLPVYPFNTQSYWMEAPQSPAAAFASNTTVQAGAIIRQLISQYLKTTPEAIDLHEDLSTMGFDSLLVTSITKKLKDQYQIDVEAAAFFEHNTAAKLIAFIDRQYGTQLRTDHIKQPATEKQPTHTEDPIAIIGLAGSFPQADDLDTFWQNLLNGKDCIEEIPAARWDIGEHYTPDMATADTTGKSYGKWGGFLRDLYYFDPLFFNISPTEAAAMNPKERRFLQCAWHVLEDAGYTPQGLTQEQVGVFAGVTRSGLDPYKVSMFPVANRVSYSFNFRGPSFPVDTACSSSLVAIHEACRHIQTGECTMAIAGGVHAFLGPSHLAALSGLHMLSPDGRSRSFGETANGMVPGEGVGAVLLKPLSRAIADHDHIYGVIRATATNHGGKANGFTVPNPQAHTQLILDALAKAKIDARAVNYVEAHGTGTTLGDPIEIRGLNEAFRQHTADTQYCPVGSVKSNIGHLEAAAGISGLTKILLQMKAGKLAPSLHAQRLNPHINMAATPFYVQQEATNWEPRNSTGARIPRLACLSSFGAGGANAHLIVEEAPVPDRIPATSAPQYIVVSAKNREALQWQLQQLLSYLNSQDPTPQLLADMAYTLQTGRTALEERWAVQVTSPEQLAGELKSFLAGTPTNHQYHGNYRRLDAQDRVSALPAGTVPAQLSASVLLDAWVKGAAIDWASMYTDDATARPYRISLPLYPFAKEYFGLPEETVQPGLATAAARLLHPLVHTNQSTFATQRYGVTLTGEEHFLRDHLVYGQKVLPGVAYLEMVHAAASLAIGVGNDQSALQLQLQHIGWIQPVIVQHAPRSLTIELHTGQDDTLPFTVTSDGEDTTDRLVHCQGNLLITEDGPAAPVFDIAAMRQQTNQQTIDAATCYRQFEALGIAYGPAHQALVRVYAGHDQVLAELALPTSVNDTLSAYQLHPSLADAAFQAIMGYMIAESQQQHTPVALAIPYALEQLTIYAPCTNRMWAHITRRRIDGQQAPTINNLVFDLDLCDEQGQLCASLRGFVSREYRKPEASGSTPLLYLQPAWKPAVTNGTPPVTFARHIVLYPQGQFTAPSTLPGIQWQPYTIDTTTSDQGLEELTRLLFTGIQEQLRTMPAGPHMTQVLLPTGETNSLLAVAALLKTAARENPDYYAQVIAGLSSSDSPHMAAIIAGNAAQPGCQVIQYAAGKRLVQQLEEYTPPTGQQHIPWKDQGVYLITGGAGGMGLQFAQEIARHASTPTILLTGRSALSADKQQQLTALQETGATVAYLPADITQASDIQALVAGILHTYQRLDGVVHAAGLLRDNYLIRKTGQELDEVMAPKVQGLLHLDAATSQLPLQFFITCASVAGAMGNVGQGDYAVANAFMDRFMHQRDRLVAAGQRSGRSLSVNWPLWQAGGMQVNDMVARLMKETLGMLPLSTPAAFEALYTMLATQQPQMMVLTGHPARLRQAFLEPATINLVPTITNTPPQDAGLQHNTVAYLKKLLAGVINLAPERIDADTSLDEYGIDSIMVMKMTTELEKAFGSLPKTLFFEYQNIRELSQYFLKAQAGKLPALLGVEQPAAPKPAEHTTQPASTAFRKKTLPLAAPAVSKKAAAQEMEVAIIGVSGKYPGANNLQEYWQNLQNGRNCITEIPKERWDHTPWFDADRNKPLKTNTKWGGFLEGIDEFDPLFFNISPREAEVTDPQERLFLQCAYETIQDAGYTRQQLVQGPVQGRVGVFAGVMWTEYQLYSASETILGRTMVLSSSSSSIANRVSYCCNFNGPSLALDTMCSSSLTAIHIACQSLRQGDCEMAIAGGVNLTLHPNKYLILGYGKLASSKGLCESFGAGGDGYVPSEGVGAVLLKPLAKAIADGDQIYGVVKGTAVNHGGKVNGYSVPNPRAQAKAVARALTNAGFHPHTISYLEAHGTGTALGDPIELAGLTEGFQATSKQYCAIGSVKSNIGHCESAAGVAGITKVLLQLKHRQLVPSLHSSVLNPNIDFANSPFVVQQELTDWNRPVVTIDGHTREYPRRAGISSFGAGGSNAHILIEEYIPATPAQAPLPATTPVAILFSAKTTDSLQRAVQRLLKAIQRKQYAAQDLANIAYTLQTGREMMEERVAMEVSSLQELEQLLTGYLGGQTDLPGIYTGKASSQQELLAFFEGDDLQATLDSWLLQKKYTRLLRLWAGGYDIDWTRGYAATAQRPQRISLPTYPFQRTRYWPNIVATSPVPADNTATIARLHPLLHHNTSTFAAQQFSATFNGQEPFLKDHIVDGKKLLPGVAYIEMIHEAMQRSSGADGRTGIRIDNMAWIQPLSVNGHPEQVDIAFTQKDQHQFGFEIINRTHPGNGKRIIHSEGLVQQLTTSEDRHLDIPAMRQAPGVQEIAAATCYALYERVGIQYGPAHRAIDRIYATPGQLLARLTLPATAASAASQYQLHPSIMDAALQAVIGFALMEQQNGEPLPLAIPFAIRSIQVMHPCTPQMWAAITRSHTGSVGDQLSFDIQLCDDTGKLCVQIEGFTSRIVKRTTVPASDTLLLQPRWTLQALPPVKELVRYGQQLLVVIDNTAWHQALNARIPGTTLLHLQANATDPANHFEQYAAQLFAHLKTLYSNRINQRTLVQVIAGTDEEQPLHTALTGLLQTAQWENPLVSAQFISCSREESIEGLLQKLQANAQAPADTWIRYEPGGRAVNQLQEYSPTGTASPVWRNNAVYLITGGAGGLGRQLAQAITATVQNTTIILTGRSGLTPDQQQAITTLGGAANQVVYQPCDITNEASVRQLVQHIQQTYGALHGIVHSAGILRDNFILKKSREELQAVLAPKVRGLHYLDEATRHEPIEVFICCSSVTGYTGNAGQADYALANAWMDRYAAYRNQLVHKGQRSGRTISVNWPLWKAGGMQVTPAQEEQLRTNYGLVPMETTAGLTALYQAIAAGLEQVMILQGEAARIRNVFLPSTINQTVPPVATPAPPVQPDRTIAPVAQQDGVPDLLKTVMSGVIKLPVAQINPDKNLEAYGIDSVMVMQMTNELEKTFGSLPKTLFFEYNNLTELAAYLRTAFPALTVTAAVAEPSPVQQTPVAAMAVTPPPAATPFTTRFTPAPVVAAPQPEATGALDIAIVGLAGRYPQASNLQAFWELLKAGANCITEVPADRWDHNTYYDQEKSKLGKTYGRWGGFLEGIDEFDPLFFGISAREAAALDPQERLFLQCAYEALEDAGYTRSSIGRSNEQQGAVGVYAGVMWEEYQLYGAQSTALGDPIAYAGIAGSIANRVSYYCNFTGMSITLNTMCSSSLTAIHLACQAIRQGECTAAIAGGVNLSLHPNKYLALGYGSFLSTKGLCESFGAGGDGYVPGEGVGAVLLKPLAQAIADNDHIYGVIKGTAVNHGGKTNSYTVPNPQAQANVIDKAMKLAGFAPQTVSYLEAHGTGTALGDPIEITGLNKAFNTSATGFCAIGSVKSNIGHCESASGIAGLTKVLLQMKHRQLVPSLHAEALNPHIDFPNSCFVVQQTLAPWHRPVLNLDGQEREYPLRAGLSSFGAGGTNAHILLEEYIPDEAITHRQQAVPPATDKVLIPLSARTEEQLRQQVTQLHSWITAQPVLTNHGLQDMAYTLQVGREAQRERLAVAVSSWQQLPDSLQQYLQGVTNPAIHRAQITEAGEARNGKAHDTTRRQQVTDWLATGDYQALLANWTTGMLVDWSLLYPVNGYQPHRISLPGYPFARERYWQPDTMPVKQTATATPQPAQQPAPIPVMPLPTNEKSAGATTSNGQLETALIQKLREQFAVIVQYPVSRIDAKEPLEHYGIDSVMIVQLNSLLAAHYGELPATLFYEYQTLAALGRYLATQHQPLSEIWAGIPPPPDTATTKTFASAPEPQRPLRPATQLPRQEGNEPIAIIGLSGRYPQAADVHAFWENLKAGKDCITEIPADRWNLAGFFHADSAEAANLGKSYGKWGGFIDGMADFDPRFFNISPKEARGMDPHVRHFLEASWQVLEDAGYTRHRIQQQYNGQVGVFAGITRAGFACYGNELMQHGQYVLNTMSAVANRVSYFLNLKGPSVPVDTMCSSSLTAIHDAMESLYKGECAMAIAGGVNLLLHPSEYVLLSANNFLSTDGRCRSFGAGGTGYVPGEGAGAVLLKPLSQAIADQDHIYAVIRSSSVNHGGKTNGYTVPNPVAQGQLIRQALDKAGIHARNISYVEAHGTGTLLGDPIEIAGLTQAFGADTADTQYCALGSSKSNIGHLEAAAGIAGLTKIILQMQHGMLVPSLHATTLNPNIQFEKTPFTLQRTLAPWDRPVSVVNGAITELPRIAGLSSFGAGGSNAHIILEEYIREN